MTKLGQNPPQFAGSHGGTAHGALVHGRGRTFCGRPRTSDGQGTCWTGRFFKIHTHPKHGCEKTTFFLNNPNTISQDNEDAPSATCKGSRPGVASPPLQGTPSPRAATLCQWRSGRDDSARGPGCKAVFTCPRSRPQDVLPSGAADSTQPTQSVTAASSQLGEHTLCTASPQVTTSRLTKQGRVNSAKLHLRGHECPPLPACPSPGTAPAQGGISLHLSGLRAASHSPGDVSLQACLPYVTPK